MPCPCGFAAAQCGKAVPFRRSLFLLRLRLVGGVASRNYWLAGKAEPYRTVRRQSRSPLLNGASDHCPLPDFRLPTAHCPLPTVFCIVIDAFPNL